MNAVTREMFSRMGGWSQIVFLTLFWFVGLLAAGVAVTLLFVAVSSGSNDVVQLMESAALMKMAQVIQTIFWLLLPALLFSYLFYAKPREFLKLNNLPNYKSILFVIVLFIAIQPIIQLVSYLNQQLTLPESLSAIEVWMKNQEAQNEKVIALFISDSSAIGVITNILIIAVLAGVVEELFFRGCMQQTLKKVVYNKHAVVWITAIIFSAIHMQFYGFLPRMLLGALLGYLFVWSNTMWVPIAAHITNNAFYIILAQIYYDTPQFEEMNNYDIEKYGLVSMLSLLLSGVLVYFYQNKMFRNKFLNS